MELAKTDLTPLENYPHNSHVMDAYPYMTQARDLFVKNQTVTVDECVKLIQQIELSQRVELERRKHLDRVERLFPYRLARNEPFTITLKAD